MAVLIERGRDVFVVAMGVSAAAAVCLRLCCDLGFEQFIAYAANVFNPETSAELLSSCYYFVSAENHNELRHISLHSALHTLSDALLLLRIFLRELWVFGALYIILPAIDGQLETVLPDWMLEIKRYSTSWIEIFETQGPPPSLEPYTPKENVNLSSNYDENEFENSIEDTGSEGGAEEDCDCERDGSWLIFDSTFGVISHEVAELWKEQAAQSENRRISAATTKKSLPPIRFSSDRVGH